MDIVKEMGNIITIFNNGYKTDEWKKVVKESVSAVSSDEAFDNYKNNIINFNKSLYKVEKEETKEDDMFEILDNESELEKTKFGMSFINSAENVFGKSNIENLLDETPTNDNLDSSFIISKEDFDKYKEIDTDEEKEPEEVKEEITDENDIKEDEVVEEVKKPAKILNFKRGKKNKAAYVDTVILCLIAQLSIFGLLIIVLLIIK